MSGGAYDYLTFKVEEMSQNLKGMNSDPRRASFQKLLHLVAEAMYAVEWVDSCDKSPGDEHEAIDAVYAFLGSSPEVISKAHSYDKLKETLEIFFEGESNGRK